MLGGLDSDDSVCKHNSAGLGPCTSGLNATRADDLSREVSHHILSVPWFFLATLMFGECLQSVLNVLKLSKDIKDEENKENNGCADLSFTNYINETCKIMQIHANTTCSFVKNTQQRHAVEIRNSWK